MLRLFHESKGVERNPEILRISLPQPRPRP
jgi:hypothetical protein